VCRELGHQTLVDNVRDPKLAERMRKLEARYRFLEDGDAEAGIDGPCGTVLCPAGHGLDATSLPW